MHRFHLEVADSDRGVYETVDLRLARHPSETEAFLVGRVLAWALNVQEGLEATAGLSDGDEPALRVMSLDGVLRAWIDVGSPDAPRLERAARAAESVRVYCHREPRELQRQLALVRPERARRIEAWRLPPSVLDPLSAALGRTNTWAVVHSGGALYVTVGDQTFDGAIEALQ